MDKKFLDAIYLKAGSTRTAATHLTQIAYRFGFRTAPGTSVSHPIPGVSDECWDRWDNTTCGWNNQFKYIKKRLDRLTAKSRPSKEVLLAFTDLRKDKVNLIYTCSLKVETYKGGKITWIECDPTCVVTDLEELR